jgi:hypothetical protein
MLESLHLVEDRLSDVSIKAFDMPDELNAQWEASFADAGRLLEAGDAAGGLEAVRRAWGVIPEPKIRCSVSYLTLMDMARACLAARAFPEGIAMMEWVLEHNPFERQLPVFWVQKGILEFEAGSPDAARASFARAWQLAKNFGFRSEDSKYLAFFKSKP